MAVSTYNFNKVLVYVNGVLIDGFGEGDAISIEPDGPSFEKTKGAGGETARSKMFVGGKATLSILATAKINKYLQSLLTLDEKEGTAVFTFEVRDLNGDSLYYSDDAWLEGSPSASFGPTVGVREWNIDCGNLNMNHGDTPNTPPLSNE